MNSNSRQSGTRIWLTIFIAMIVVRMWLTAGDEFTFQTNDTRSYSAIAATYPQAGSRFPNHLPGMPLLSNFVTTFGIPFKLFLDALLILSVYLIIDTVSPFFCLATGRSLIIKSLMAGAILFNPWFFCWSRIFMTEALTSILLLSLPVSMVSLITQPVCNWKTRSFFLPTILTTCTTLVRPEFALLGIFWLATFALLIWFHFGSRMKFRSQLEAGGITVLSRLLFLAMPVLFSWLSLEGLRSFHKSKFGVRGAFVSEAEGLSLLLNALYQIKPEKEIRFVPVPLESLRRACNECPTLKRRQHQLLDTNAPSFGPAYLQLNLENEIGTWLNWHLVWAFQGVQKESNLEMLQCVQELHQAFEESRLEKRKAFFPIDPLIEQWMPDLGPLLKKSLKSSMFPHLYRFRTVSDARLVLPEDRGYLEDSLLPRKGTVSDPPYFLSASFWIPAEGKPSQFERLHIVDQQGREIGSARIEQEPNRSFVALKLEAVGYSVEDELSLKFAGQNGTAKIPFKLQESRDWKKIELDSTDSNQPDVTEFWSFECHESGSRFHSRERAQASILKNYNRFLIGTIAACFVLGVLGCVNPVSLRQFFLASLFLGFLIFGRCAMYTLTEAWTNWGLERYVGPNCLVTVLFALSAALVLGATFRNLVDSVRCRFHRPASEVP